MLGPWGDGMDGLTVYCTKVIECSKKPSVTHIGQDTLKGLGWLTVKDRGRYFALLHVFRVKNGCGPAYLRKGFVPVKDVHDHKTRGSSLGFHISANDVVGTFEYFGKKEWNEIPERLKTLKNINAFKTGLKESFLERY